MGSKLWRGRVTTALLTALLWAGRAGGQGEPTTILTFAPTADTYVDAALPTLNFNANTRLRADSLPSRIIYLRFTVTGVRGRAVRQARLRLGVSAGSSGGGGTVHLIADGAWDESTMTYLTRPEVAGPALATLGAVATGTVVEFSLGSVIDGDGVYNFALTSDVPDGVTYVSSAALGGQIPQLVLTVEAAPPAVTIVQPAGGSTFYAGDPVTLQASAADDAGTDLSQDVVWSSDLDGPLGSGVLLSPVLSPGIHTVTARIDGANGLGASAEVRLSVVPRPPGNTEPLVAITAPLDGQGVPVGRSIGFAGTANDLEDGVLTGGLVWTSDLDGVIGTGGSFSRALGPGTHRIRASVADGAGLRGSAAVTTRVEVPLTLDFPATADAWVDEDAPTTKLGTGPQLRADTSPERITYLRFAVSGIGTRSIARAVVRLQVDSESGAESDSGGTLRTVLTDTGWQENTVTYNTRPRVDGLALATAGPATQGQLVDFDVTAAMGRDGVYNFAVVSASGNGVYYRSRESGAPARLTVTLVGSAPQVRLTSPADHAVVFGGSTVVLTASATDADDGDLSALTVWSSSLDGPLGTGASLAASLRVGTHTITAAATDPGGLTGKAEITLRVRGPNGAPAVTITAPPTGTSVPAGTRVTLSGVARDDFDGTLDGAIRWRSSLGGDLGTGSSRSFTPHEGLHTITAKATDSDGATGTAGVILAVTPSAPVVQIAAPAAGTRVTVGSSVTFSGTARDATDGDLSASLKWISDLDGLIGMGPVVTARRLRAGIHVVTAAVMDSGGLAGQAEQTIVVAPNEPPMVNITTPAPDAVVLAGDPLLLEATADDPDEGDLRATLRWSSSRDGALGSGGSLSVSTLSVGRHTLAASTNDAHGAPGGATVTIDVVEPVRTFAPVADTFVDSDATKTAHGAGTELVADASPTKQILLRFALAGLEPFRVVRARLRLTVGAESRAASDSGGSVRTLSSTSWSEATTWAQRPAVDGPTCASQGKVAAGQLVDLDVTRAVRGDGDISFAIVTSSGDSVYYQSREAASGAPELVVTLASGPGATPAVTIKAPAPGVIVQQGTRLTLTGTASDVEDGTLSGALAWRSDRDGALGTGASLGVTTLTIGTHRLTAAVTDRDGNTGTATTTIQVVPPGSGYRDYVFGSGVARQGNEATSQKPESKLWVMDGAWWATLWNPKLRAHRIHRLDWGTQVWVDQGPTVDERPASRQDVLPDGTKLYMVSRFDGSPAQNRLLRYTYHPSTRSYSLDSGFPVKVSGGGTESISLAKDSTGTLWIAYTLGSKVWVNRSLGSDTQWGTPFVVPVSEGTSVISDDIATVHALPGKIGVFWANQLTDKFYLAVHRDGASATDRAAWTLEVAAKGGGVADDHFNVKVAADGRLFAAVKTSENDGGGSSTSTLIGLLVRSPAGVWSPLHKVAEVRTNATRPICLLDELARRVYVFYSRDHADIYYKTSSMEAIAFPSGAGTAFITTSRANDVNDPTSTKQNVDAATTGIVVEASSNTDESYWHNVLAVP